MKFSRLTLLVDSVPIENAISGVAILLDLDQEVSGANGVKPSGRHKDREAIDPRADLHARYFGPPVDRRSPTIHRFVCSQAISCRRTRQAFDHPKSFP